MNERIELLDSSARKLREDVEENLSSRPEFQKAVVNSFWKYTPGRGYYDHHTYFFDEANGNYNINLNFAYGGRGHTRSPEKLEVTITNNDGSTEIKIIDFNGKKLLPGMIPLISISTHKDGIHSTYANSDDAVERITEALNKS